MFEFHPIPYLDKTKFYRELRSELMGMYANEWVTNLANVSAALMAHLPRINWVGFYLFDDTELYLGPFQGLPACLKIPLTKGVCGSAASSRKTILVDDVEKFPGHIACDARSRSELVVPLIHNNKLIGVLDIDSPEVARFDQSDVEECETLVRELIAATKWPETFKLY